MFNSNNLTFQPKTSIYYPDGSGRDQYISFNNGGLSKVENPTCKRIVISKPVLSKAYKTLAPNRYYGDGSGRDTYVMLENQNFHYNPYKERSTIKKIYKNKNNFNKSFALNKSFFDSQNLRNKINSIEKKAKDINYSFIKENKLLNKYSNYKYERKNNIMLYDHRNSSLNIKINNNKNLNNHSIYPNSQSLDKEINYNSANDIKTNNIYRKISNNYKNNNSNIVDQKPISIFKITENTNFPKLTKKTIDNNLSLKNTDESLNKYFKIMNKVNHNSIQPKKSILNNDNHELRNSRKINNSYNFNNLSNNYEIPKKQNITHDNNLHNFIDKDFIEKINYSNNRIQNLYKNENYFTSDGLALKPHIQIKNYDLKCKIFKIGEKDSESIIAKTMFNNNRSQSVLCGRKKMF